MPDQPHHCTRAANPLGRLKLVRLVMLEAMTNKFYGGNSTGPAQKCNPGTEGGIRWRPTETNSVTGENFLDRNTPATTLNVTSSRNVLILLRDLQVGAIQVR